MGISEDLQASLRDDPAGLRRARRTYLKVFRQRWTEVAARLGRGEDVAAERADCFLATKPGQRRALAKRFYSLAHARRIAAWTLRRSVAGSNRASRRTSAAARPRTEPTTRIGVSRSPARRARRASRST